MKQLILILFLLFTIPTFSQENNDTEIISPIEGEEIDVLIQIKENTEVYGTIRVKIHQWWFTGGSTIWEGIGIDEKGNYWYLEHRYDGKTYAIYKL